MDNQPKSERRTASNMQELDAMVDRLVELAQDGAPAGAIRLMANAIKNEGIRRGQNMTTP